MQTVLSQFIVKKDWNQSVTAAKSVCTFSGWTNSFVRWKILTREGCKRRGFVMYVVHFCSAAYIPHKCKDLQVQCDYSVLTSILYNYITVLAHSCQVVHKDGMRTHSQWRAWWDHSATFRTKRSHNATLTTVRIHSWIDAASWELWLSGINLQPFESSWVSVSDVIESAAPGHKNAVTWNVASLSLLHTFWSGISYHHTFSKLLQTNCGRWK